MHVVSEDHSINRDRHERVKYIGFTTFVGLLLLLNATDLFSTISIPLTGIAIDTAILLTFLAGYKTFYNTIGDLMEKKISADLAICIAALAALLVGEYLVAAEAMFIMLVGEGLEAYAAGRTEAAIHRFVEQLPHKAMLLRDGEEIEVPVEELAPGDVIVVRAGERIAADGLVKSGQSSVDESPITGESVPRDKGEGEEVYAGTVNGHGLLHVQVTSAGEDSTIARVVKLVREAKKHRAPVVRTADRYAQYFLPALLLAAGGTYYLTSDWMRTVAVLIVGCPCALILATPAAMVAAIGGLARRGILVRGGAILQWGAKADTVVFDKTGTLTSGRFQIVKILTTGGRSETEVLSLCASAESGSDHPLAKVIVESAREREIPFELSDDARVIPGRGAECHVNGTVIRAGNEAFLADHGIEGAQAFLEETDKAGATAVLVGADGDLAGAILLRDSPREGAAHAVREIEHLGITNIILLTGDRRRAAEAIAREVGISHVESELLPEQKLDRVRQLQAQGRSVIMVGDGVNDAPALAAANVGVAVAGSGADIAAEAADVVDLNKSLEKLPRLIEVSRRAVTTVWQNIIIFAGLVNVIAVLAAGRGLLGPIGAAITHQIASLLVMVNSVRLLKVERPRGARSWYGRLGVWLGLPHLWDRLLHEMGRLDPAAGFAWIWERRVKLLKPASVTAVAIWILSGVYTVPPEEVGIIERFGRKVLPYKEPGLHFKLPAPIDRLHRVKAKQVRVLEIGFRVSEGAGFTEPPAYEWNVQHRGGRMEFKPEESLMLTGDQNMVEMHVVVHYDLDEPGDFVFEQFDAETTLRVAAESSLRMIVNSTSLDDLLTIRRRDIEKMTKAELQQRLTRYRTGVRVLHVRLQDVHPSVEVVDAFREVAGALEEKIRMINQAEGYRNERVALARGQAEAQVQLAEAYKVRRTNRASGDASRFVQLEQVSRAAPQTTRTRLYLETMEEILPRRKKLILDSNNGGRRNLFSIEEGVILAPAGGSMRQPPLPMPLPGEED